jgi:hypothetical protein
MDACTWAFNHSVLNSVIARLQEAFFLPASKFEVSFEASYRKAGWVATLLANSTDHKHRQKALLFAALSKLVLPQRATVETLCYTIFSRIGNLPAAMHLSQVVGRELRYIGPSLGALSIEFLASYRHAQCDSIGGLILTEFQNQAMSSLLTDSSGIISGPPSAGKSFIIHEYIKSRLADASPFVSLFIVPTKALIAQVCSLYRIFRRQKELKFSIYSSVPEAPLATVDSAIFALTQERCIRLLSSPYARKLSFIFADEVQSLEKEDRGALLEYVLHELRYLSPDARCFAAGPFIANSQQLGENLFGTGCRPVETRDAPVSQILVQVTPIRGASAVSSQRVS